MLPDVKRLYAYHVLNGVTMSFMTSALYIDNLLLRSNIDMQRFGLVLGLGMIAPAAVNMILSPLVAGHDIDRHVAGFGGLARAITAYLFLIPPWFFHSADAVFYSYAALYVLFMSFGYTANNSLMALCRRHIPTESLGTHSSTMMVLWQAPASLLGIGFGMLLEHNRASNDSYLFAALCLLIATTSAQIPAIWLVQRLGREANDPQKREQLNAEPALAPPARPVKVDWRDLMLPLRDVTYRPLLIMYAIFAMLQAGIGTFVWPYLKNVEGWSLGKFGLVNGVFGCLNFALVPLWGKVTDRIGGRNVLSFSMLGMSVGVACLAAGVPAMTWIFVGTTWLCMGGIFGSGVTVGIRYMQLAQSDPVKTSVYVGVLTFLCGLTGFLGAFGGGYLLDVFGKMVTPENKGAPFRILFIVAAVGLFLTGLFAASLTDGKRKIGPIDMAFEFLAEARNIAERWV
jgi:hypothetical protein